MKDRGPVPRTARTAPSPNAVPAVRRTATGTASRGRRPALPDPFLVLRFRRGVDPASTAAILSGHNLGGACRSIELPDETLRCLSVAAAQHRSGSRVSLGKIATSCFFADGACRIFVAQLAKTQQVVTLSYENVTDLLKVVQNFTEICRCSGRVCAASQQHPLKARYPGFRRDPYGSRSSVFSSPLEGIPCSTKSPPRADGVWH